MRLDRTDASFAIDRTQDRGHRHGRRHLRPSLRGDYAGLPLRGPAGRGARSAASPSPGRRLRFTATAYCKGTTTASGVNVRTGIAAADPDLLPVGSVIQVDRLGERYNGIYTIMDTGPKVQGRHIDIYMWSCHEALDLGRRNDADHVLRLGWNPKASTPRLIDRLFRQREVAQDPAQTPAATPPPATEQAQK